MKNSEIIDDNIDQLKECPKCNYYYTDGMPFLLVGKPFKNGIRAKYTNFKCSGCNTDFISFTNYNQVLEAELAVSKRGEK